MAILARLAHLVPQALPWHLERLSSDHLGLKDHQEPLDLLDNQGEMDRREPGVKKEIQVREVLKDFQV